MPKARSSLSGTAKPRFGEPWYYSCEPKPLRVVSSLECGRRLEHVQAATGTETRDFDALFAANYAGLARVIWRVVGDSDTAEDLASETFWKLHRNPPASDQNLAGWLYRTGLRLALDHLRKRKRRLHYEAMAPGSRPGATPEQALQQSQERARVRQVLAALRAEQAGMLVLRSEGHTLAEIASTLYLNPGSVGTLLARAEAAFREEYVNRYGER